MSDALDILSGGGLVRFDGLLLRLYHELWPWARAVSCFVGLCKTVEVPGELYINHINRGFGSRDQNWGSCKYAQTSLRTLLYGSPLLCVVWFCEIRRPVNF